MKHRQLSLRRLGAALLALCTLAAGPGPALAVTQIDPAETISTSSVSLIRGQSCKTDAYYSVTRVKVGDRSVAAASADSAGRVIITALAAGQTTVTYYSMSDYTASWVYHTVNVTIDGGSSVPSIGLRFSTKSFTATAGKTYRIGSGTLTGTSIAPDDLLWLSSDENILAVERDTGRFTARSPGTARLIAVTTDGNYSTSITISVLE